LLRLKETKDTKETNETKDAKETKAPKGSKEPVARATTAVPILPPGIEQYFISTGAGATRYRPVVLGIAKVTFADSKLKVNATRDVVAVAAIGEGAVAVDWASAEILEIEPSDLATSPDEGATFDDLPRTAAIPKNYAVWQKGFSAWLAGTQKLELRRHVDLKLTSSVDESERDFRIRVQDAQREARDSAVDAMRRSFAQKRARLEERLRRAEQGVKREADQASQAKLQTAVSLGATLFGALLGRKTFGAGNLGRATTTARGAGRAYKESEDVGRAQQDVEAARRELENLDAQIAEETAGIAARYDAGTDTLDTVSLAPKRGQILVQTIALGWTNP